MHVARPWLDPRTTHGPLSTTRNQQVWPTQQTTKIVESERENGLSDTLHAGSPDVNFQLTTHSCQSIRSDKTAGNRS